MKNIDPDPVVIDETPVDPQPAPKPVTLKEGERRVMVGGADGKSFAFVVKEEDVSVEVGDWCRSEAIRFDSTLLSAFASVMRANGKGAGKPAFFEAEFRAFARKEV